MHVHVHVYEYVYEYGGGDGLRVRGPLVHPVSVDVHRMYAGAGDGSREARDSWVAAVARGVLSPGGMTSRWGSERVLVRAGRGYREGPRFEERPRPMPRGVRWAIAETAGLVLVRLPWLALFALLMHFVFGYDAGWDHPRAMAWPVVLTLPGVILCGRLAWTALALGLNRAGAAELARGSAWWLRIQQIVVIVAGTLGTMVLDLELALWVAAASIPLTWATWAVARALDAASSAVIARTDSPLTPR